MADFSSRKAGVLRALGTTHDKSPKGSVDEPIRDLIDVVNRMNSYFTTSSCSGRISLFLQLIGQRKGGKWLLISHSKISYEDLKNAVLEFESLPDETRITSNIVFRFEPFILTVECESLEPAVNLLQTALSCGFRESGLTSLTKRYILTLRSSIRLEVPITDEGGIMVSDQYLDCLVKLSNKKFDDNFRRTDILLTKLKALGRKVEEKKDDSSGHKQKLKNLRDRQNCVISRFQSLIDSGNDEKYSRDDSFVDTSSSISENLSRSASSSGVISPPGVTGSSGATGSPGVTGSPGWALLVDKRNVVLVKDALKEKKWLDFSRKISPLNGCTNLFGVPLLRAGASQIHSQTSSISKQLLIGPQIKIQITFTDVLPQSAKKPKVSPFERLRQSLAELLPRSSHKLLESIPSKWERLGDCVLLPQKSFVEDGWDVVPQRILWKTVADALNAKKVAKQYEIDPSLKRHSRAKLLYGSNGWVKHRENSIWYCFDVTKCMFSSGNVTEKNRMANICSRDEVVLDLYCGIGYFTFPFLVHGKVQHVHACEWNDNAIEALKCGLKENNIASSRISIHEGDNRKTTETLVGIVDRVCLGLLPSSEDGWPTAIRALKSSGGWLHVHGNVPEGQEEEWSQKLVRDLYAIAQCSPDRRKRAWKIKSCHIERVKSYAPRINHIVVDVSCEASPETQSFVESDEKISASENLDARTIPPLETKSSHISSHSSSLPSHESPFVLEDPMPGSLFNDFGLDRVERLSDILLQNKSSGIFKVFVSTKSHLDPHLKNYTIKHIPFPDLLSRIKQKKSDSYFIGPTEKYFGQCIINEHRICLTSSNLGIWIQEAILGDLYISQIFGKSLISLFPPSVSSKLYKSYCINLQEDVPKVSDVNTIDADIFVGFPTESRRDFVLNVGDILFLPKQWNYKIFSVKSSCLEIWNKMAQ